MPPRHYKTTPKASVPLSPPKAPTRRQVRSEAKAAAKKPSPKIVKKSPINSDELFAAKDGRRGSLKYGTSSSNEEPPASDTPGDNSTSSPAPRKKVLLPVKTVKTAGSRRVAPRPVKRDPNARVTRSHRRAASPIEIDSDIEIVMDGTVNQDEGYESSSDMDVDKRKPVKDEDEEMEVDDGDADEEEEGEEEGNQQDDEEDGGEEESGDDSDEDEDVKDFINNEPEESEYGGTDDLMADANDEAEDGDEDMADAVESSSPLPYKISGLAEPSKNKRSAVVLSDAEDMPATRKRRTVTTAPPKTIEAVGHTKKKVTLTFRGGQKEQPVSKNVEPSKADELQQPEAGRRVQRRRKVLNVEDSESQAPVLVEAVGKAAVGKGKAPVKPQVKTSVDEKVKALDKPGAKAPAKPKAKASTKPPASATVKPLAKSQGKTSAAGKSKSKTNSKKTGAVDDQDQEGAEQAEDPVEEFDEAAAEEAEYEPGKVDKGKAKMTEEEIKATTEPQDRGCEVTKRELMSDVLMGTYFGLDTEVHDKFSESTMVQTANPGICIDEEIFGDKYDMGLIVGVLTVICIPTAHMYILSRISKRVLAEKGFANGTSICPANAPAGELADCIQFGFVETSSLIEGRGYKLADGSKRVLKEITFYPLTQEWERAKAVASGVFKGKVCNIQVNENGAIAASSKHAALDEDGNPEQKKPVLSNKFLTKTPKAVLRNIVHESITRRPREGTDAVPVFNSTANFKHDTPLESRLKPEEVLTQRRVVDPSWNQEIPPGSLVAVHSTVSLYVNTRATQKNMKTVSFNLLAIQIIALPVGADFA